MAFFSLNLAIFTKYFTQTGTYTVNHINQRFENDRSLFSDNPADKRVNHFQLVSWCSTGLAGRPGDLGADH